MANDELPAKRPRLRGCAKGTPAHLLMGRAGPAYPTATANGFRADHAAAALDAVHDEIELQASS